MIGSVMYCKDTEIKLNQYTQGVILFSFYSRNWTWKRPDFRFSKISSQFYLTKKKFVQKWPNFQEDAHCSENYFLVPDFFFCATFSFEIWSILVMIVFAFFKCFYRPKKWCLSQKMHMFLIGVFVSLIFFLWFSLS